MATPGKSHYNAGKLRVEEISGSNKTIAANETGELYLIIDGTGVTVTLPQPTQGAYAKFLVGTSFQAQGAGEGFSIHTPGTSVLLKGSLTCTDKATANKINTGVSDAANDYRLIINGTNAKDIMAGSSIECIADGTSWHVNGLVICEDNNISGSFS